ncbi:MAG: energy-coupling factor ABC transporter ATP-binding protein [Candidatus Promineifilaceae bacterium]
MHHTIEVENLHFSYPDGRTALNGVTLSVAPGHKTALVGPNGAGKSTLLLHLNGVLRGSGSVQVAGMEVKDENLRQIRAAVGLVFQDPDDQLFSPTVFDDVAFGPIHLGYPEEEVRARVDYALSVVQMEEYAERVPHHLSIGEKKRISIATVVAMDPEILVLDEPTAGLDPRARRSLINLLADLDMTMLVSTHDMMMVSEIFPELLVMDGGLIVREGNTDEIMADNEFLSLHGLEMN